MMNSKHTSTIAFIDLLFNMMLGFVFLFIISFLLINIPKQDEKISPNVEFLIVMTWNGDQDNDLDIWVSGPSGIVSFVIPQRGSLFLEKDDLGMRNDTYQLPNGDVKKVLINQEVVKVRGIEPGTYTVNVHYYSYGMSREPVDSDVTVSVTKITPFDIVFEGTQKMTQRGQEVTFVNFRVDDKGLVTDINTRKTPIVYNQDVNL